MCVPVEFGGLGIRSVVSFNQALLGNAYVLFGNAYVLFGSHSML